MHTNHTRMVDNIPYKPRMLQATTPDQKRMVHNIPDRLMTVQTTEYKTRTVHIIPDHSGMV